MNPTDWRSIHGDAFDGTRALVTGGAGFIGSHLTDALIALGAHVTVLDDLTGGDPANLDGFGAAAGGRLRFVEGSILDADALAQAAEGCVFVFHHAAWGSVPGSVADPDGYHRVNVTGTRRVLEAAHAVSARRVVFAASSAAYGDAPGLPKAETMPPAPLSPYAEQKVAGEALMREFAEADGPGTVSLRYFNIFGPRQNANSAYAAVIAAFAKALHAGDRPTIFGDGTQTRDFAHVDNVVHANLLAAQARRPLTGRAVNIGCGAAVSVNELARQMMTAWGVTGVEPVYADERPGDVKHSLADITLARELLGYAPVTPFADGLAETVAWYRRVL